MLLLKDLDHKEYLVNIKDIKRIRDGKRLDEQSSTATPCRVVEFYSDKTIYTAEAINQLNVHIKKEKT